MSARHDQIEHFSKLGVSRDTINHMIQGMPDAHFVTGGSMEKG
jgi:hypothetical protein